MYRLTSKHDNINNYRTPRAAIRAPWATIRVSSPCGLQLDSQVLFDHDLASEVGPSHTPLQEEVVQDATRELRMSQGPGVERYHSLVHFRCVHGAELGGGARMNTVHP